VGTSADGVPVEIDTTVPHEARINDYWLGGKDNFASDRALGDLIKDQVPAIGDMAKANRAFLGRSVRYLAAEAGIRQFLDVGSGIPTAPNVHQVAQEIEPSARVLYVDNDPLVLAHARALMSGTAEGRTAFILGDFTEPDGLLNDPVLRETIDLDEPVALLLIAVLMYFDAAHGRDPYPVVRRLVDALPSGSYVALTHPTGDFDPEAMAGVHALAAEAGVPMLPRNQAEVAAFLDGLEPVEPGVVPVAMWRPTTPVADPHSAYYWAGVARKP
jgi:O-methyltransferase involved in polyketide biosynthesis